MADAFVQLPDDAANTGKKVDNDSLTVGANTVHRQRVRQAGGAAAELLDIRNAAPGASDYGIVTRVGDGHDVAKGATADAAVTTDVAGTLSGKLRGLVKWAFERMPSSLGQKVKSGSLGVVIASDQDTLPVDVVDEDARILGRAKLLDSGGAVIDPAREGGNLATLATTLAAIQAALLLAQGALSAAATGPMVQGQVGDTPPSYLDGVIQPLSLTSEGRLRVSSQPSEARADVWGDFAPKWFEPQADSYSAVEWAERSIW